MPNGVPWTSPELELIRAAIPNRTRGAVARLVDGIQAVSPNRSAGAIRVKLLRAARESDYIDPWIVGRIHDKWRLNVREHGRQNADPRSVLAQTNMPGIVRARRRLTPRHFVLESVKAGFLAPDFNWRTIVPKTKVCCHCKEKKPGSDFGFTKASLDGLTPTCRVCWNEVVSNYRKKPGQK